MKKITLLLCFFIFLTISHSTYAQQEEYAFIEVTILPGKAIATVTKNGQATQSIIKPEETGSLRVGIIELMNALNKEGYQVFSVTPVITGSNVFNEHYLFIKRK